MKVKQKIAELKLAIKEEYGIDAKIKAVSFDNDKETALSARGQIQKEWGDPLLNNHNRQQKVLSGTYFGAGFDYSIFYDKEDSENVG